MGIIFWCYKLHTPIQKGFVLNKIIHSVKNAYFKYNWLVKLKGEIWSACRGILIFHRTHKFRNIVVMSKCLSQNKLKVLSNATGPVEMFRGIHFVYIS